MNVAGVEPRDFVVAGLFAGEQEVVDEAIRFLIEHRPDLRLELAVHLYANDQDVSLGGAAQLAGMDSESMMHVLTGRGIPLRLAPATHEDARAEVDAIKRWSDGQTG